MSEQAFIQKMKEIQSKLLEFLHVEGDFQEEFKSFRIYLDSQKIHEKDQGFLEFIHLLSRISNNHPRTSNLISKICQILLSMKDDIKQNLTNFQIYDIFSHNKLILLFLLEKQIIILDESINYSFKSTQNTKNGYQHYFLPEILSTFLKDNTMTFSEEFKKNRQEGENHHYICQLIRNDSIDEFIHFVNKNSVQLESHVPYSIFESNEFLLDKNPTLIEYAAFFGSIQIFKYLKNNKIEITENLFNFVIHSNNAELFQIIDELVDVRYNSNENDFLEAINCFNNDIANYIISNSDLEFQSRIENSERSKILNTFNFEYFPILSLNDDKALTEFIKYDYYLFAKSRIENSSFNVNKEIIFKIFNNL